MGLVGTGVLGAEAIGLPGLPPPGLLGVGEDTSEEEEEVEDEALLPRTDDWRGPGPGPGLEVEEVVESPQLIAGGHSLLRFEC